MQAAWHGTSMTGEREESPVLLALQSGAAVTHSIWYHAALVDEV